MAVWRDLAMGDDGDLAIDGGKTLALVADAGAIRQQITIRLRMFAGEYYADQALGVDYAGKVLTVGADAGRAEAEIKRAILGVPGVADLLEFALDLTGGDARVTFSATAATGELVTGAINAGNT